MAYQIGPDDHNDSDWFRTKYVPGRIAIIFIYQKQQSV